MTYILLDYNYCCTMFEISFCACFLYLFGMIRWWSILSVINKYLHIMFRIRLHNLRFIGTQFGNEIHSPQMSYTSSNMQLLSLFLSYIIFGCQFWLCQMSMISGTFGLLNQYDNMASIVSSKWMQNMGVFKFKICHHCWTILVALLSLFVLPVI